MVIKKRMNLVTLRQGPPKESPRDPVDLLLACHAHIRSFTAMSLRLAGNHHADDAGVAEAAGSIARYFEVALPLHSSDEDLLLLPRLWRASPPGPVRAAITEISRQHAEIDRVLARLLPCWRAVEQAPRELSGLARRIGQDTGALAALWDVHLELEEATVFPVLRELLTAEELAQALGEMRARRQ